MRSHDSNFSGSDAWHHKLTPPHPRFLPSFWQPFKCLDSEEPIPTYTRSYTLHSMSVRKCHANQDGSISPVDEGTLVCFAFLLAHNLNHSSINVYPSAVRSLHIDHGFPDPLVNCLCLQCLLRGIKQIQDPASPRCLPIIADHLKVIQCSWELSTRDHVMMWAVCCLGCFFCGPEISQSTLCLILTPNDC